MELELIGKSHVFYDTGARLVTAREQTQEQVVPDACPDILRIITTYGSVYASETSLHDGRAEVSGTVRAAVLYLPESGEGVEQLVLTVPFTQTFETPSEPGDLLFASAELESVDARTINPRKVLVRANVRVTARVLRRRTVEIPATVNAPRSLGVRTLEERTSHRIATAAACKAFTVSDVIELGGAPAMKDIIRSKVSFTVADCNIIGRRAVFKATALVETLYRAQNGAVCSHRAEVPFSQIVETEGLEDGAEVVIVLRATGMTSAVRHEDGGRAYEFSVSAEAQTVAYSAHEFAVLADLYSTSQRAETENGTLELETFIRHEERRATVRATLETGAEAREAEDAEVCFTAPATSRGEDGILRVTSNADVRVRYTGEDGTQYQTRGRIPVSIDVTGEGDCSCELRVESAALSAAVPGGIEIRLDVAATLEETRTETVSFVRHAKLEEYGEDAPPRPSVVLRYPQDGETMWQLAKRFCTTEADIRDANGMAEDSPPDSKKLMLIPKRR